MRKIVKICLLFLLTLAVSGCAKEAVIEEEQYEAFSITREKQSLYLTEMQKKLDEFYWRYSQDSVTFEQGVMPDKDSDNYDEYKRSFETAGVNYADKESMPAIVASMSMLYYNGDEGGTAHFYFVDDELSGVYYSAPYDDSTIFSLKERNVFLSEVNFESYESDKVFDGYIKSSPNIYVDGFDAEGTDGKGNKLFASINLEKSEIYIYTFVRSFTLIDTVKINDEGYPLSAAFVKNSSGTDTLAVLVGEEPVERFEFSDGHIDDTIHLNSKYILFYDKDYKEQDRLELSSVEHSMIMYEDDSLILGASNGLEYYTNYEGIWVKSSKTLLSHSVNSYLRTNMLDGTRFYIMSDGLDLYMYTKNSGNFNNIWRTHISAENFMGSIYAGDLNCDGVKEIYVCDSTNTVIRYILTPRGLVSQNSDILYGERIYAADFNSDGIDDYIKVIDPETEELYLFLSQ